MTSRFYSFTIETVSKRLRFVLVLLSAIAVGLFFPGSTRTEVKPVIPSGRNIPKLESGPDDPELLNGHVYPNWGPICQRYTYSVIYQDGQNRPPEYVKIYFNGRMIDLTKEDSDNDDYFRGVKYLYQYVPNKLGSNFYYFEASNGLGKARSNIIDSPDNGPVLFESAFDQNEIAVVDVETGAKILSYRVGEEWVGGVALSDDGRYLAAKTNKKIYFFETAKPEEPLWTYEEATEMIGDVKGGVDISGDGQRIIASIGGKAILFAKENNTPLWVYQGNGNNAYNVATSKDGKFMAMGTAGGVTSTAEGYESSQETNLLIFWSEKSAIPLWQYHATGNFHDVSLSDDGNYITGATGCPDRRFYLFGRDSNEPIIRSEMLTRDSPVHRAKISGDGEYAAVGSESDDGAVFLFSRDDATPLWKAPMPERSSARALNFTSDGRFIGAATFKGDVFIFGQKSNVPVSHWQIANTSFGGIDIAEDGQFVAAGGNDNRLYLFRKDLSSPVVIDFDEYLQEVDIAANGRLVAAGTGGSVYFFESFEKNTSPVECEKIKEPPPEEVFHPRGEPGKNSLVPSSETGKCPGMFFGFGFLAAVFTLVLYFADLKYNLFLKLKIRKAVISKDPPRFNKKIVIPIVVIGLVFLSLTVAAMVLNTKGRKNDLPPEALETESADRPEADCGNNFCEPDFGETKTNCPQDCSGG